MDPPASKLPSRCPGCGSTNLVIPIQDGRALSCRDCGHEWESGGERTEYEFHAVDSRPEFWEMIERVRNSRRPRLATTGVRTPDEVTAAVNLVVDQLQEPADPFV